MKLILGRYFLYTFIAIEVLILPKLVSPVVYANIEYYKFILYFMPFLLIGANSGYVYYLYNQHRDYFSSLFFIGSSYFLLISLFIFIYTDDILLASASLLMTLFTIIEQKVKTEKFFLLAMSIKPLISLMIILVALLYKYDIAANMETLNLLYYAILLAFVIWVCIICVKLNKSMIADIPIRFKYFIMLIRKGFLINVGTLMLMAIFFTDRYFTKNYYPDYLGTYSFSYNIVQFIVLALTTLAYANVIEIGEEINKLDSSFLYKKLITSYKIFFFLFVFFILFVFVLTHFYSFIDLLPISLMMGFFMGGFYATNSISSVAQYKDLLGQLTIILLLILIANILLSYIFSFYQVSYLLFTAKTGLLLFSYSLFLQYLIFRKIQL